MPTITIRNGDRTMKLTQTERRQLTAARDICEEIYNNYPPLEAIAKPAWDGVARVLQATAEPTQPAGK